MGVHKQRWTAEEEAALKAGVVKHGVGKWRTILTDPEFCTILHLRSNVDLKDKWRNINVTANGWGSRHRARLALKKSQVTPIHNSNPMALSTIPRSDEEIVDSQPLAVISGSGTPKTDVAKEPKKRLDSLVIEAITSLKEPGGSDKHAIAMYIEEQYWAPPNLKKLLSTKLKVLSANGKLMKVKRKYRIAPNSTSSEVRSSTTLLHSEKRKKKSSRAEKSAADILTKCQIVNLSKMTSMTPLEAAEAAARAVAEAEAAIAEAEEAERLAEAAEAEAEAAQIFAEAAMKAWQCRTAQT